MDARSHQGGALLDPRSTEESVMNTITQVPRDFNNINGNFLFLTVKRSPRISQVEGRLRLLFGRLPQTAMPAPAKAQNFGSSSKARPASKRSAGKAADEMIL